MGVSALWLTRVLARARPGSRHRPKAHAQLSMSDLVEQRDDLLHRVCESQQGGVAAIHMELALHMLNKPAPVPTDQDQRAHRDRRRLK